MNIPNGWTTRICQAILTADKGKRVFHKPWHRVLASTEGARVCSYCQKNLTHDPRQSVIDYLVPLQLGGPSVDENRVLACPSCARSKGHKDLVSWKAFSRLGDPNSRQTLLDRRTQVLAFACNHLTDTYLDARKKTVMHALEKRWDNPRFTVYAVHGTTSFIGWTTRNGAKEALGLAAVLLRFSCKAVPLSTGKVFLYELPSANFLNAVWLLIEHHALVKKLEVDGLDAVPMDAENWQHHWSLHLEHVSDLCRRRARYTGNNSRSRGTQSNAKMRFLAHGTQPGPAHLVEKKPNVRAPRKPREQSSSKNAIGKRERRKLNAVHRKNHAYLEARAVLDNFKERVRQGKLDPPTAQELDLMEREVLALL